jgi:hypothetical protein
MQRYRQKTIYQGACLLGSKCGKIHLRASVKSKKFSGGIAPGPPKKAHGKGGERKEGQGRGREVEGRGRMGWGRKGRRIEGRAERWKERDFRGGGEVCAKKEGREKRGKGRAGKWKERDFRGGVCVMAFGGMDAPDYLETIHSLYTLVKQIQVLDIMYFIWRAWLVLEFQALLGY